MVNRHSSPTRPSICLLFPSRLSSFSTVLRRAILGFPLHSWVSPVHLKAFPVKVTIPDCRKSRQIQRHFFAFISSSVHLCFVRSLEIFVPNPKRTPHRQGYSRGIHLQSLVFGLFHLVNALQVSHALRSTDSTIVLNVNIKLCIDVFNSFI